MANQSAIPVADLLDRAAELLSELEFVLKELADREARERHPHFPRPVAWPPEPSAMDRRVAELYADGGGRVSQAALCPVLAEIFPEKKWNQSAVRTCLTRVARWETLARLRALAAANLL